MTSLTPNHVIAGKPIYWIKAIPEATKFMLYKDMGRRLPFLRPFTVLILTRQVMQSLMNHYRLIEEKTRRYQTRLGIQFRGAAPPGKHEALTFRLQASRTRYGPPRLPLTLHQSQRAK